jgi:hypothetical protein
VVPTASARTAPAKSSDPNAIRTLVLTGLPKDLDKNTLWKKIRKLDGVEKKDDLVYPVEKGTGEDGVADEAIGGMGDVGESPLSYVFVSPSSLTMHRSAYLVHQPRESHRWGKEAPRSRVQGIIGILRIEKAGGRVDEGGRQRSESSRKIDCQELALEGETAEVSNLHPVFSSTHISRLCHSYSR